MTDKHGKPKKMKENVEMELMDGSPPVDGLKLEASSEGIWGNNLAASIDREGIGSMDDSHFTQNYGRYGLIKTDLFNLTVQYILPHLPTVTERFINVSITGDQAPNRLAVYADALDRLGLTFGDDIAHDVRASVRIGLTSHGGVRMGDPDALVRHQGHAARAQRNDSRAATAHARRGRHPARADHDSHRHRAASSDRGRRIDRDRRAADRG